MLNVIFCGFGKDQDKRVVAKNGDLLLRVASSNGVTIPTDCTDGMCGACVVSIEDLTIDNAVESSSEEYSTKTQAEYMDDKELTQLIEMGAISKKEAEIAQQFNRVTPVRLACQCVVRSSILVKPFK
jgi:ferredoxin